jgi:hypothetical protein
VEHQIHYTLHYRAVKSHVLLQIWIPFSFLVLLVGPILFVFGRSSVFVFYEQFDIKVDLLFK